MRFRASFSLHYSSLHPRQAGERLSDQHSVRAAVSGRRQKFGRGNRRDAQDVILHFKAAAGEIGRDALLEFGNGGRAVEAVESASVVHENDVLLDGMT